MLKKCSKGVDVTKSVCDNLHNENTVIKATEKSGAIFYAQNSWAFFIKKNRRRIWDTN